jgi:serine protease AprX
MFILNAIVIDEATQPLLDEIARRPDIGKIIANPKIQGIQPDTSLSLLDEPVTGQPAVGANITSTGADQVWNTLKIRGENIVVAGQDTGIDWNHPALKPHYRGWDGKNASHDYNWHDAIHAPTSGTGSNPCGYDTVAPCDDDKHGTHTMGTMVGAEENGANQVGMAPGAKFIGCRNMDKGVGTPSSYLECFQFFLAPWPRGGDPLKDGDPTKAPHVINNSWGCPADEGCEGSEMIPALDALQKAGIFVVASAGNDGPNCSTIQDQPAQISALTFSVGAHDHRSGKIASFSSRGPSKLDGGIGPDVTAPGVNVRSTTPKGGYEEMFWSGTSMAGPHVVGQVALIWSAQPKLIGKVQETSDLIRRTSTATTSTQSCGGVAGTAIPNNTFGYGRINALESVKAALAIPAPATLGQR